jgi:hypothetical protein
MRSKENVWSSFRIWIDPAEVSGAKKANSLYIGEQWWYYSSTQFF